MFHPCWSSLHALPANTYFTWHLPMNIAYSQMHVLSLFLYFCSLLALSDSIEQVDRNYYVWPYSCTHIKRVRFGCVLCNNWMAIDWFIYRYWIMDVDVMMMYGCQYVFWTIQLLNHDVSFFFFFFATTKFVLLNDRQRGWHNEHLCIIDSRASRSS